MVHLVIQVLRSLRNCQSRFFAETHDPGLGSLMFRCSQAFVAWPDTLDRPWKLATRQELIIFVDPWPLRGYFLQAHCGLESRGYSWLLFSGWLWPWIGVAIFGYPWLFFGAVAIFLAAGIFAVFFVAIFLKCRKYRQKNSRVAIFCWCAWLFFVAIRGYSWLSVAIFRIRGYF